MAKILNNPFDNPAKAKTTDVCDSFLYPSVREKLDSECAAEKQEYIRQMLEAFADLIGETVRTSSERCTRVLSADKTLKGLYLAAEEEAKKLCSPAPGKLTACPMSQTQIIKIAFSYYGFDSSSSTDTEGKEENSEAQSLQSDPSPAPSASDVVSLFDLL